MRLVFTNNKFPAFPVILSILALLVSVIFFISSLEYLVSGNFFFNFVNNFRLVRSLLELFIISNGPFSSLTSFKYKIDLNWLECESLCHPPPDPKLSFLKIVLFLARALPFVYIFFRKVSISFLCETNKANQSLTLFVKGPRKKSSKRYLSNILLMCLKRLITTLGNFKPVFKQHFVFKTATRLKNFPSFLTKQNN